ncbi:carboxypeptidase-like regulatory domain-containing protein [Cellulophaga lytica]|nr:carboxypeptidase-like regulatory domain-containing protein [Cellulophaga lytica]
MILSQTKPQQLSVLHSFLFSFILLFFGTTTASAQEFHQFKGEILDSDSKKPLVFATLSIAGSNISSISNAEGKFSLKVPNEVSTGDLVVSFLGYKTKKVALESLKKSGNNKIYLDITVTALSEINISAPKDPKALVLETLKKRGDNYFEDPTLMTAFYKESIKKRRKNISLSEAVVNIYKAPYSNSRKDVVELYKTRKSTNYSKMDTLALKLQGGPFNALYVDVMKYPQYIFGLDVLPFYEFSFDHSTRINNKLIYVISFKQNNKTEQPLYKGKLYIDADKKILTSAIYSLNIIDKQKAAKLFVRKKPNKANVWPTDVAYRVDYREKNNKWYYSYSSAILEFKIDWDSRLFNSVYSMSCEMAITDWEKNENQVLPKGKDKVKMSIILGDEAVGFSDPNFWGEYNIIEPEKSIESAIKKIKRQLKRTKGNGSAVNP